MSPLRRAVLCSAVLALLAVRAPASELRTHLSLQGYTGLLNTPNAAVTPEGSVDLLYSNQTEAMWRDLVSYEDNYMMSIGLLPYTEGGARFTEAPGKRGINVRDLSASFKVRVPRFFPGIPDFALGVQDVTGGKSRLRTAYGVASQEFWRARLSLGYGLGPDRLEGVFGGAELRVLDWVHLLAEHDAEEAQAGVRLSAPRGLLPRRFDVALTVKTSLEHDPGEFDVAVSLRLPLGLDDTRRRCDHPCVSGAGADSPPEEARRAQGSSGASGGAPNPEQTAAASGERGSPELSAKDTAPRGSFTTSDLAGSLREIRAGLVAYGFQNVRVGTRSTVLYVEYENSRFNHNELDGLGLVMGHSLTRAPIYLDSFVFRIRNEDIAVVEVSGPVEPFRSFFDKAGTGCAAPDEIEKLRRQLRVRGARPFPSSDDVVWVSGDRNPKYLRSSLILSPAIENTLGTELGVLDYRLSLKPDLHVSLWPGGVFNVRWGIPFAWSDDFEEGEAFNRSDNDPDLERVFLNQGIPLAPGLTALIGAGRYSENLDGVLAETVWAPGRGTHRFLARAGYFDRDDGSDRKVLLGSYRFYWDKLDLYLEGIYGQYLREDYGPTIEVRRFFGDTSFTLFYTETTERIGGFWVSLPLTPRRDMAPWFVQVRGPDRFAYGLSTVVTTSGGRNPVTPGVAIVPQTSHNLERTYYNTDRLNERYIRQHIPRLLDAYLLFRDEHAQ